MNSEDEFDRIEEEIMDSTYFPLQQILLLMYQIVLYYFQEIFGTMPIHLIELLMD